MKFNTTYIPKISLKETIKELESARNFVKDYLKNKYELTEVSAPVFLEKNDNRNISFYNITRPVTFDLGNEGKIAELLLSPTNWMRSMIHKLNLKTRTGLITNTKSVYRDLVESPTSSAVNDEIVVQVKYNSDKGIIHKAQMVTLEIYKLVIELSKNIETSQKVKNIYPKKIKYVSSQELENEYNNATFSEREINYSFVESAYFLASPGTLLFSGHIHSKIQPEIYDLKNFFQLVMADTVNSSVIKPITVAILASGVQLDDQIALYDKESLRTSKYYLNLIEDKSKIIEIKINVPKLLMALLHKGHISEMQPDVISDESNIISLRHKVEKM